MGDHVYRRKPAAEIRRNMSAIRSKDTKAERRLRSELHRRGLRYRTHHKTVAGKPDMVFPGPRVAVFVDGDFWHARTLRERGPSAFEDALPRRNRGYWRQKLTGNARRDQRVTDQLVSEGWHVIRLWETELKQDLEAAADKIEDVVRRRSE